MTEIRTNYYSVPYSLMHEAVDVRASVSTVEIFHRGQRVAAHARSDVRGRHTTEPAHMPKAHQRHPEWTPSRIIGWAQTIGPATAALVEAILADRPHPEQDYRSCLGILRLAKAVHAYTLGGRLRPRRQCGRALVPSRRLDPQARLDRTPLPAVLTALALPLTHEHVRGADLLPLSREEIPMLTAPTLEKLQQLKLDAMAQAWTEQQQHAEPDQPGLR